MFSQAVSFLVLVILQDAACACYENETIQPVELNFVCLEPEVNTQKIPILFIHGFLGSLHDWCSVTGLINETGRKACAIDLRNHGDSPWTNRTDVASMTADVEHFLDEQGMTQINLIGHSLGGKVALDFTLKHPDNVTSLVVEEMRPNGVANDELIPVLRRLEILRDALEQVPENSTVDQAREIMYDYIKTKREEGEVTTFNESIVYSQEINCSCGICHFQYNIEALTNALEDPECFLTVSEGLYSGPTLFIYGELSPFQVGEDKDNILRLFPEAKLVEVPNAGNEIHGKFPEFEEEVTELLNSIDS